MTVLGCSAASTVGPGAPTVAAMMWDLPATGHWSDSDCRFSRLGPDTRRIGVGL
jgi:hypothetical protein